jgi:hypothetical protein
MSCSEVAGSGRSGGGSKVTLVAEGGEPAEAAVLGAFRPHPGVVEAGPEVSELGLGVG